MELEKSTQNGNRKMEFTVTQLSFLDNETVTVFNKVKKPREILPGFMKGSYVIYEGPSSFDGAPIVVIATGLKASSQNSKTGDMVQTWILRADEFPVTAMKNGNDISVCGDCKHRRIDGLESCYVNLGQGPRSIFEAYRNGRYEKLEIEDLPEIFSGFKVRLGAYGDPMAVPFEIWENVLKNSKAHTGYSHQWSKDSGSVPWNKILMASVDTPEEKELAEQQGWRTFRVRTSREALHVGEIACPASAEMGKVTDCSKCKLCSGNTVKAKNIAIIAHGVLAMKFLVWRHQMAFEFMKVRSQEFNFSA